MSDQDLAGKPHEAQAAWPSFDDVTVDGNDVWLSDRPLSPSEARHFWRDAFAADRLNRRNRARLTLVAHVSPSRRAPRQRKTRRVRAAATAKSSSGDPGGDGDPDAVSPELGRFLDWLADQACREVVKL